jgi:hypothetical protein
MTRFAVTGSDCRVSGALTEEWRDDDTLYGDGVYLVSGVPTLNYFDDHAADTLRGDK